jgi:polyisoprenyl-phosphate glycosyltransferase
MIVTLSVPEIISSVESTAVEHALRTDSARSIVYSGCRRQNRLKIRYSVIHWFRNSFVHRYSTRWTPTQREATRDYRPSADPMNSVSVVIPVYNGAATLPDVVNELKQLRSPQQTPDGRGFRVDEVLLVWDRGVHGSEKVVRELAANFDWVRPVWLSRNFGQHPATLAGMTSAGGDWIVTMDEDGQHDPAYIGDLLDIAYRDRTQLVYASPSNRPPHGVLRNAASWLAKWLFVHVLVSSERPGAFNSYRLILGEAGRSVAAYTGAGVYLDVALSWVVTNSSTCQVLMRDEGRPASSYSLHRLVSHFWRLVISSGTRPLRFVSVMGVLFACLGLGVAIYSAIQKLVGDISVPGWTSVFVAVLVVGGATLLALGIIAEYIAAAATMAMGKPVYVIMRDPGDVFDGPAD